MVSWSSDKTMNGVLLLMAATLAINVVVALSTGVLHVLRSKYSDNDAPLIYEVERSEDPQRYWLGIGFFSLLAGSSLGLRRQFRRYPDSPE